MEMTVKDERKLVEIWLTNAEKSDPVLRAGLQSVYDTYKKKKYLVAVFESGSCDLYEQTRDLLRRGYKVMIGRIGNTEVDFVAEKQGAYTYYQVTADMTAQETFEREMRPLAQIRDNYEKIILTADRLTVGNYNGIRVKNLTDWLLGKEN